MNRLYRLILFVWLLGTLTLLAQQQSDYFGAARDHAALFQGRIEPNFTSHAWQGLPYWGDKEFQVGDIIFDGILYQGVGIRYDVFSNQVVVQSPLRGISVAPDQRLIAWYQVDGERYVPAGGRFCRLDFQGSQLSLLFSRYKIQSGDVIEGRHTYHTFATYEHYLLLTPDQQLIRLSNLSSLTSAYPDYKQQLKQFSRDNRLKYKDAQVGRSLQRLVSYLDQLLQSERPLPLAPERQAVASASVRTAPDSVFQHLATPLTAIPLPSYDAFLIGNTPQYDPNEQYSAPDIVSDLEPIREDRILDEVTVRGFQQKVNNGQVGMEKFRPAQLKNIPLALGEADVMKMVQTLPGVKTVGEAASGFNVRGGASDQNLILLNGNTIFNPMHLFGVFSAFNGDVIGETELYKSGIPSQYGGRISSVMDIHSRVADWQKFHGSASIGLLTSKGNLEVPVVRDRVSLLVGGRTTYSDWMLEKIPEKSGYQNGKAGFWDVSANLSAALNARHYLNAYFYGSHDRFSFTENDHYGYTNLNGALDWRGRYAGGISSTVSLGVDTYSYDNEEREVASSAARLSFAIRQYFLRSQVRVPLGERHELQVGLHSLFYQIHPGKYEPVGDASFIVATELGEDKALETSLFAEDNWRISERLKLTAGLRYSLFNSLREGKEHTYQAPEIRLAASYKLTDDQSVKAGFNTMHQYIHKVSNTSIMSPTDTWTLSNESIKPQSGWQVAAGYYAQTSNAVYELSIEAYYKQMSDYLTYRSAGKLLMNPDLENDVLATRGRAYGVELQLRKAVGRLNGWISYSYSRTELQQNDGPAATAINRGEWFPAEYDRPHEVKMVANYKFTQRYSFSLNADYSTGRPTTVPAGKYYNEQQGQFLPFYTDRNGYRLPDYFRMDCSFNVEPSHHLTALTHSWFSVGCYNLLGRKNAYSVYYLAEEGTIQGYRLSIFGAPIPFVSYNIKF